MGCGKSQYLRFHLNLTTYDGKMVPCMHLPLTCLPMQRRAVERFLTSGDAAGGSCASDCRDLLWVERGAGGESEELVALCVKLSNSNPILRSGHGHLWGSLELGAATTGRLVDRAQGIINRVHLPINHNQPLRCCARAMRSARSKQSAVGTPLASRYALRRAVDIASSSTGDASD